MAVSSIAKIIAKNLAKKKQLQTASKKITSKDVKEVYRESKKNPGGARKVPTLSKPRTARTGPIAQKTSSGGVKVTTLGGRKGKKPDTSIKTSRALSKDRLTKESFRDRTGPIESGVLSPRGLNRPLGSAKKPAEKPNYPDLTPAQRERYEAMLKASSKKFSKERRKFEKTSIAKRKERAGKPLSGTPRPSRDKSLPSMESRKATTDKRITELTPREIAILRKVGKRDYSRGEVNTLAERTVQGEANRRVEQGLRNKKARNDVQNEITRIENRIAEAQRVRRNAERVRRLEADKRALQAFLNSRKKGK
jgi:hypothetical protein